MANSKTYQGQTREEALSRASADLGWPVNELAVLEVVSRRSPGNDAPVIEVRVRAPEADGGLDEASLVQGFRRSSPAPLPPVTCPPPPAAPSTESAIARNRDLPRPRGPSPSEGVSTDQLAPKAEAFLLDLLRHMGVSARLETGVEDDNVNIEIVAEGGVGGLLIGRQGQTLDAIQYLVNRVVLPGAAAKGRVYLDTEGYRARYRRKLEELAHKYRDEAVKAGKPVTLEEFSSRDRWIIHQALLDDPLVTTRSVGEEPDRKLMIIPRR